MVAAETERDILAGQARQDRSAEAMYRLGIMFSTGQGVPYDPVLAHQWFNLAAMQGSDEAKARRRELADEMSPEQIAEAQRRAREWLSEA